MSNKYDLKMIKRGMQEFKNIIGAFSYLMDVGAIGDVDLYNEYCVKDDAGNPQDFSVNVDGDQIILYFMSTGIIVINDSLSFVAYDDNDKEYVIFEVQNPNDITNEESFFQANTLYDLTDIEEGHVWFTTIMDCYAAVMDFLESDDV